jgi:regulator of protease activity HflC (stomatin/prohibitin superfamily)
MMEALLVILVILVVTGLIAVGRSLRVVQQYEQGIVFRFGRVLAGPRGPGLTIIRPFGDRMQKVNMQIVAMAVPAQEGITRDNVSVRVDAVVYFRVVDPIKATINVQNYLFAISQQAQTSLRSIIGQSEMDQLLAERDTVNRELRRIIDEPTEGPWGIRVERVEIKDVSLPEGMKRSMSRQAEAERERRARIITADGEYQASKRLAAAANVMARDPAALQLRLLQTVVEVAGERNSTLVMPVPVELLRFFDKFTPTAPGGPAASPSLADFGDAAVAQAEAEIAGEQSLEIPEVPAIPELPEELAPGKELGTSKDLGTGKSLGISSNLGTNPDLEGTDPDLLATSEPGGTGLGAAAGPAASAADGPAASAADGPASSASENGEAATAAEAPASPPAPPPVRRRTTPRKPSA